MISFALVYGTTEHAQSTPQSGTDLCEQGTESLLVTHDFPDSVFSLSPLTTRWQLEPSCLITKQLKNLGIQKCRGLPGQRSGGG